MSPRSKLLDAEIGDLSRLAQIGGRLRTSLEPCAAAPVQQVEIDRSMRRRFRLRSQGGDGAARVALGG